VFFEKYYKKSNEYLQKLPTIFTIVDNLLKSCGNIVEITSGNLTAG